MLNDNHDGWEDLVHYFFFPMIKILIILAIIIITLDYLKGVLS